MCKSIPPLSSPFKDLPFSLKEGGGDESTPFPLQFVGSLKYASKIAFLKSFGQRPNRRWS
jgi:hypothetical protein